MDEILRQRILDDYGILDSPDEQDYDDIVKLAAFICKAPMAAITFIDRARQWTKAQVGLPGSRELPRKDSFCAHAIQTPDQLLIVRDTTQDPRFAANPLVTVKPELRFYAGAPMVGSSGAALGTLCVCDDTVRGISEAEAEALRQLSRQVVAQLELRHANTTLTAVNGKLALQSMTDALTCVANRRAFNERLAEEVARSRREDGPLCLLMADIDHFKSYNDSFGHLAGDEALHSVAQILSVSARPYDFVARYGGEEFAVILPNTTADAAAGVAERLRLAVSRAKIPHRQLTLSFGVATLYPDATPREIILEADTNLYQAKLNGRNMVVSE
jgi:diguanylate cyclase (GGDEF)-like protein